MNLDFEDGFTKKGIRCEKYIKLTRDSFDGVIFQNEKLKINLLFSASNLIQTNNYKYGQIFENNTPVLKNMFLFSNRI